MGPAEQAVRKAESPQEALLAIAKAIDDLADGLLGQPDDPEIDEWAWKTPAKPSQDREEDEAIVEFAKVDTAVEEGRRDFAETKLHLKDAFPKADFDPIDAYAAAGPRWLWEYNRDLVLEYPYAVRQAMIRDLMETEPNEAPLVARDILKDTGSGKPTLLS